MAWEISIPSSLEPGLYDGLEAYDTKEEAIAAAKATWGADDNGMVSIVNELPEEEEEEETTGDEYLDGIMRRCHEFDN